MVLLLAIATARILENRPDRKLVPPSQQESNVTSLKNNQSGPAPLLDHPHQFESTSELSSEKKILTEDNMNSTMLKEPRSRKNAKIDKRNGNSHAKTSHYVFSANKGLKKQEKQRKLVAASTKFKPERKLYYVLNKTPQKSNTSVKLSALNVQKTPAKFPTVNRQLNQKNQNLRSVAQPKKLSQKPQVKSTPKSVTKSNAPQPSLKKSFVVSKKAVQRVRKLVEGDQDGERKLQSIPLLLFGDYEIIIEKK